MDFSKTERENGVRWSWNVLPSCRLDAARAVLPVGCLYTPLANPKTPVLQYEPIVCNNCTSILNPYCRVDFRSLNWVCPFCFSKNSFPSSYNGINEQRKPAELYPQFTSIEYTLKKNKESPAPAFIFVIDTCIDADELDELKDSILRVLDLIPENTVIGLITFGTTVQIYELGFSEFTKSYIFRGDKETTLAQMQEQMDLKPEFNRKLGKSSNVQQNILKRFLLPVSECEISLTSIIEELETDPWPIGNQKRSRRCGGSALSIATSLLEGSYTGFGAHIMLFQGGPCTVGEGKICSLNLKEQIRSHNDLRAGKASFVKPAIAYYNKIGARLVKNGHTLNVFGASLNQLGIIEIKTCCESTGGSLILTDSFTNPTFNESLPLFFQTQNGHLDLCFNGNLEIKTSKELKICGGLGPMTSLRNNSKFASTDNIIGKGRTNMWKINSFSKKTTLAFYFEIINQKANVGQHPWRYIQFVTTYQHSGGDKRLRVTTQALPWVSASQWSRLSVGFDQQAACVLMARWAIAKAQSGEHLFDVLRWLDRNLIKLISKFGQYQKDDPNSLNISSHFSLYPQFMYHLRRSQFLRVFNSSPDETSFYRLSINSAKCSDSITMIQPTLRSYEINQQARPVLLDTSSVKSNNILLLDTFFEVLIHHGETICDWRDKGYQEQEKYKNFKLLLLQPKKDAKSLIIGRYPYPAYVLCDEDDSASRILAAKINPSNTHRDSKQQYGQQNYKILTDDASLQDFMKHLKKLAVSQ